MSRFVFNAGGSRLVLANLPGTLSVSPETNLSASGVEGDSLSNSVVYTLRNVGTTTISWTAAKTQAWVTLSATSGTLAAGASTTVTVSLNSGTASLADGAHSDTVTFTNTTNGNGTTTRGVSVTLLDPSGFASSVTKDGITWTFGAPAQVGQYVNGDWWVVGPVTITAITRPHGVANVDGSTVDPVANSNGYDGGGNLDGYNASLNVANSLPYVLATGKSLVSTISWVAGDPGAPSGLRPKLKSAAVLTCVASAPAANSFRPNYAGTTKRQFTTAGLDLSFLPSLTPVAGTPSMATVTGYVSKLHLDHWNESTRARWLHPSDNMPDYGRDIMHRMGDACLMLLLNPASVGDKTQLAYHIIQQGIDRYGDILAGAKSDGNGGHSRAFKLPILLAGKALNDTDMLAIGTTYAVPYTTTAEWFGEDGQTFYIASADVSRTLDVERSFNVTSATGTTATGTLNGFLDGYATVVGSTVEVVSGTGSGQRRTVSASSQVRGVDLVAGASLTVTVSSAWTTNPDATSVIQIVGYESANIGTAEWGVRSGTTNNKTKDNPSWDADYRICCTACAWSGHQLVALACGLKTQWNHNPFFDYVDRYMNNPLTPSAFRGYGSPYAALMWDTYRSSY